MTALGSNAHMSAKPHRRQDLRWCSGTARGRGPAATVQYPGIAEPMLVVRFPDGGSPSIEFTGQAPDDDHPRLGAWPELRAEDPAAVMRAALDARLPEVKQPGHQYYVMMPGGQVFTITVMVHVACVSDRLAGHAADLGAGLRAVAAGADALSRNHRGFRNLSSLGRQARRTPWPIAAANE
jgi:hypothetical protein